MRALTLAAGLLLGAVPLAAQTAMPAHASCETDAEASVALCGGPADAPCDAMAETAATPSEQLTSATEESASSGLLGRAPDRRRIIPALLVTHPFYRFPEIMWSRGAGIQASTWFAAGFINSYDRLSMIVGVERTWVEGRANSVGFGLGYRAGLITGYDERLLEIARHVPALPFGGLLAWVDLGRVAIDTFYVYKAWIFEASFGF